MNEQVESVIESISKWNDIKTDKTKVFSLWQQCSSFKVVLPIKSNCQENFHIYFGVKVNKKTLQETIVMHLISDYNDTPERIRKIENVDDYIYSAVLDNIITESAEIDEVEANARAMAWQNPKILKNYLENNQAFDVFIIGKGDFLAANSYTAYFGMKLEKVQLTYSPDLIIHNFSPELTTSYYDLARLCPPYGTGSIFGLQDLACL